MSKVGASALKGAEQALAYAKGQTRGTKVHKVTVPDVVDVREIRTRLHMTREGFAGVFGFSIRTVEKWEQNERQPEGPTRAYLMVIANNPKAVIKALAVKKR